MEHGTSASAFLYVVAAFFPSFFFSNVCRISGFAPQITRIVCAVSTLTRFQYGDANGLDARLTRRRTGERRQLQSPTLFAPRATSLTYATHVTVQVCNSSYTQ